MADKILIAQIKAQKQIHPEIEPILDRDIEEKKNLHLFANSLQ